MASAATSGLVAFIKTLTGEQLEALFVQPYAVVALLRSLQPLARSVVMRFAWTSGGISSALVTSWARLESESKLEAALRDLIALRLLSQAVQDGLQCYVLHPSYQQQLRRAMCSGMASELHAAPTPPPPAAALPSAAQLTAYARGQWEALLLYLVDSSNPPPAAPAVLPAHPAVDIPRLMSSAGLMIKDEYTLSQSISERGFQFLLADRYTQLWGVVRQYLAALGGTAGIADLAVAINFLLRLGLQGGRPMSYHALGPAEGGIATHMAQLGLLQPVKAGAAGLWLCPTRLAALLAGGGRAGEGAEAVEEGYVIVESNFRVYAYTTSAVQVSLLRVFVRCDALLPNLFVGTLTRDSATSALTLGITADQMVAFLRQHAHPRAAAKPPIVPGVVADQLRLWQQELGRLRAQRSTIYQRFDSPELYAGAVEYARQAGALLFCSQERGQLAVEANFHDAMRAHLRSRKQALGL